MLNRTIAKENLNRETSPLIGLMAGRWALFLLHVPVLFAYNKNKCSI